MLTFLVPVKLELERIHTFEKWIVRALELHVKVILIFDGTALNLIPQTKLNQLQEKYTGLSYFNVNFGNPGEVRNFGLSKVTTKWVAFIDSDDNVYADKYIKLIQKCQHEAKPIGIGYFSIKDLLDTETSHISLTFLSRVKYPGIWRYVFETQRLRNQEFCHSKSGEDLAFLARLQIRRKELCIGEDLLYEYNRNSPGQLTKSLQDIQQLTISLKEAIRDGMEFPPISLFSLTLILKITGQIIKANLLKRDNSTDLILAGGIGNQLFQIAGALSLANPFPIFIEQELGKNRTTNYREDIFQIIGENELQKSTIKKSTLKVKYVSSALRLSGMGFSNWHAKLLRRILEIAGYLLLFRRAVYIDRIPSHSKRKKRILIGYFQGIEETQMISSFDFQKYLDPPKLNDFAGIHRDLSDERSLVIHVRGGDYANEETFGLLGIDYFEKAILRCLELTEIERYFLFTNDLQRCKKVIPSEIFKNATIYSAEDTSASQSLFAMSAAKNLILSNSTFSWWAAYLGEPTTRNIFLPEPWFKTSPYNSNRARPGWIPVNHNFMD